MRCFVWLFVLFFSYVTNAHTIYFFPGQGSDSAIFSKLNLPDSYKKVFIHYPIPNKGEDMQEFAGRFVSQINEAEDYSFIGVSLGGMICTELADILNPKKVVIISSAKTQNELPKGYRFQKRIPINKIIPPILYSKGALLVQPLFEPDRNKDKEVFKRMLSSKDPVYLKRTVEMIINWERTSCSDRIVHIHGAKDNTIPLRNVDSDVVVEDGSHMMVLTRPFEINEILLSVFN